MKVAARLVFLWVIGMVAAHVMFLGLSSKVGYGMIFSWWFVTYFTYLCKSIKAIDIVVSFALSITLLSTIYLLGWHDYFYHGIPDKLSLVLFIIVLHGVVVTSPLVFNKVVKLLIAKFS